MERITLYGSFTPSSSYKPMLYPALARLPFSFRTVNLKFGRQKEPEYLAINRWGVVPSLRHRGLTILQSNVILDYLARETGHFEGKTEQACWQAREWLSWEADHITAVARVRHSARFRKMQSSPKAAGPSGWPGRSARQMRPANRLPAILTGRSARYFPGSVRPSSKPAAPWLIWSRC